MQTLVLEISDPEVTEMLIHLAKKLNVNILKLDDDKLERSKKALEIMRGIAKRCTLGNSIPDPVEWQKEIRKDKILFGREE